LKENKPKKPRNGRLKIELAVEDALRAALETRPPPPSKKRPPRRQADAERQSKGAESESLDSRSV
jgi:hypothetical protein